MKTLYKWLAKCTDSCGNTAEPTQLVFITETNEKPSITCGPCNGKSIEDIMFVESYTVSE